MITSLDQLAPDARAAARSWLDASARAVGDERLRADVLDELRADLLAALDADSTPEDVDRFIEAVGPVTADEAPEEDPFPAGEASAAGHRLHGSIGGIPYDVRPPTGERIRKAWWDPANPRVVVPRAFGAGWAINAGAVAVRLGLLEPDAEDEPFASTPERAFRAGLAVPVALTAATVAHYAVRGRRVPSRLPGHWDLAGRPDAEVSRRTAAATDLAMTAVPTAIAAWTVARGGSPQRRAGLLAAAAMTSTAGAWITVWRSAGDRPRPWAGPGLALAMVASAGATLFGLAVAGRNAERARDLGAGR